MREDAARAEGCHSHGHDGDPPCPGRPGGLTERILCWNWYRILGAAGAGGCMPSGLGANADHQFQIRPWVVCMKTRFPVMLPIYPSAYFR